MTIEQLEALERAKDDPTCTADEFVERCTRLAQAQQAAFPHLLAVAKAAKVMVNLARQMERGEIGGTHVMATAANEAEEALTRLESQ